MNDKKKRIARLRRILARLKGKKIVQNREMKTALGSDAYAQYLEVVDQQRQLREDLVQMPDEIAGYARRLNKATLLYGRADAFSGRGQRTTAEKMFRDAETQFERLLEYLEQYIAGQGHLEMWFDRKISLRHGEAPNTASPDDFPCVVTSRSLRNRGGGILAMKLTSREVKTEAIERELESLTTKQGSQEELTKRMAAGRKLKKLAQND